MKTYMFGMGSFDWSLNIHVWNISRNFWYAYHFIHETFDSRIILYTKLLIRVSFYTRNFWYAYRFINENFDTRIFSNVKLFIRGTFAAFCPIWPTIYIGGIMRILKWVIYLRENITIYSIANGIHYLRVSECSACNMRFIYAEILLYLKSLRTTLWKYV